MSPGILPDLGVGSIIEAKRDLAPPNPSTAE